MSRISRHSGFLKKISDIISYYLIWDKILEKNQVIRIQIIVR